MRIIVPIKQVPETNAVKMDEATGTMIREGVEAIINPLDLYAIELAIRLREQHALGAPAGQGSEVIAISMGPPKAMSALKEAIAMGCDRAVLISDKAFAGSDTWATSYVLAAAIRRLCTTDVSSPENASPLGNVQPLGGVPPAAPTAQKTAGPAVPPDTLIVCGERATDGDTGQVGPGIASFLDLPVISYVSKVDEVICGTAAPGCAPQSNDKTPPRAAEPQGSIRVHRLVEDGYEVLEMSLPGVLTVVKEVADPRLPTLRGKQKAKKAAIPVWGAKDMDTDPLKLGLNGSPTRVVKIFRPTVARKCEKLPAGDEAAIAAAVDKVVTFLQKKELI
jgi:electron transfer flavoprotein beta subunit